MVFLYYLKENSWKRCVCILYLLNKHSFSIHGQCLVHRLSQCAVLVTSSPPPRPGVTTADNNNTTAPPQWTEGWARQPGTRPSHSVPVLGRIVKFDWIPNTEYIRILKLHRIPNTEYIRLLKNERIRIPNSVIRT